MFFRLSDITKYSGDIDDWIILVINNLSSPSTVKSVMHFQLHRNYLGYTPRNMRLFPIVCYHIMLSVHCPPTPTFSE